eukprot:COSAG01_NODE_51757_length_352_cov_0.790514_1_plen_59_part_01
MPRRRAGLIVVFIVLFSAPIVVLSANSVSGQTSRGGHRSSRGGENNGHDFVYDGGPREI